MTDPRELLDLLIEKAPALRAAGVIVFEAGTLKANLMPADPPEVKQEPAKPSGTGDLNDPALYPGGIVPGYGPPTDET